MEATDSGGLRIGGWVKGGAVGDRGATVGGREAGGAVVEVGIGWG